MSVHFETKYVGDVQTLRKTIPLAEKITPAAFEREREQIFRRSWLFIGHTADLPLNGSYFVRDLPILNVSLLVVRGNDGVVRTFHNICRHRGNIIVRSGQGCKSSFTCGFHGWSWRNTGEILNITDAGQFDNIQDTNLDLIAVPTETWNGFIFVNFEQPRPRESLREWLAELYEGYEGYFEAQEKVGSHAAELKANWNLAVNAFTEGYHTFYVHRQTQPDYQGGKTNPQRHRPFMQMMKRHIRYSAPANPDHKLDPVEEIAWRWGHRLLPATIFDNSILPPGVNPSRAEHFIFDVVELFPNLVMLISHYWHMEITYWPVSSDLTLVAQDAYAYRPANLAERVSQEFFKTRARDVMREDMNTLEDQHKALSCGVLQNAYLSRQETALAHHYRVSEQMLAGVV